MRHQVFYICILFSFLFYGCKTTTVNVVSQLSPRAFAKKLQSTPGAVLLDVRTPEEFSKGHLQNALNNNWNDSIFKTYVAKLDKTQPIFIYCLSGGRSTEAANYMDAQGFKKVYALKGGIMKWHSANLPIVNANSAGGITPQTFDSLITSDKKVLVDFYANWCAPCKEMEPFLHEIARDTANHVQLVRIDVDANPQIAQTFNVNVIPVLHLYKNKKLKWAYEGFIGKQKLLKVVNQ